MALTQTILIVIAIVATVVVVFVGCSPPTS